MALADVFYGEVLQLRAVLRPSRSAGRRTELMPSLYPRLALNRIASGGGRSV